MKTIKTIIVVMLVACIISSCIVEVPVTRSRGHHYGWYKNPHNPHYRP